MKSFLLTITLVFHVLEATSLFIAGMLTVGVFNMSAHSTARISHPAVSACHIRIHHETQHLVFLVFMYYDKWLRGVGRRKRNDRHSHRHRDLYFEC